MKKRFAIGVLALLVLAAVLSWGWYFVTRLPDQAPARIVVQKPRHAGAGRAATTAERRAAAASIIAQLEAFKADDYILAATYQSQSLKANFGSTEAFRRMIQANYPQFAHYKKASFGKFETQGKGEIISAPIVLVGADGVKVRAVYTMVLEKGKYRVASVNGGASSRGHVSPRVPDAPPGFEKIAPLLT